jgi:hypothetical protein
MAVERGIPVHGELRLIERGLQSLERKVTRGEAA